MTLDRQANARVIGQLEAHLAELEGAQQRKASGRAGNLFLFVVGAVLLLFMVAMLSISAPSPFCLVPALLVGVVLCLAGGAGYWDAMQSGPRLQADIVSTRSKLAELRALMMG